MAITWSRLHEIRGLGPRPLTYADIVAAVDEQTGEEAGLDWKGQRRTDEAAKVELAKDVAAMANSGGGVIVFGVGEKGTGTSKEFILSPVELTEQAEQQVRGAVSSRVRPMISGIAVDPIPDPDDGTRGFVVVSIPASPEAPHFYEKGNEPPAAPWRNGSHTENMRESQIERAYMDRFDARASTEQQLDVLIDHAAKRLDHELRRNESWVVVSAQPLSRTPRAMAAPTLEDALAAVNTAGRAELHLMREPNRAQPAIYNLRTNPRPGLRRWVFRFQPRAEAGAAAISSPYGEVHHDGSVVVAMPSGATQDPADGDHRRALDAGRLERSVAAAVSFAGVWASERGVGGTVALRAAVVRDPQERLPLWIFGAEEEDGPFAQYRVIPPWTHPVDQVERVDSAFSLSSASEGRRAAATELAESVLHQFGYAYLTALQRPS